MTDNKSFLKRRFFALGGRCKYACAHCYTFRDTYEFPQNQRKTEFSKDEGEFDIAYISGHRDSFIEPDEGISFCEEIFESFKVDILLTTRNIFSDKQLMRLSQLNRRMRDNNNYMFFCASIPAEASYKKIETSPLIPSPKERIAFLKAVHSQEIFTILTLRPLFPEPFIPVSEPISILEQSKDFSDAVLASGLMVDSSIIARMDGFPTTFKSHEVHLDQYLGNNTPISKIDVSEELEQIRIVCAKNKLELFHESSPAISYIKQQYGIPSLK